MALEGRPLAPGHAVGPAHRVERDDLDAWTDGPPGRVVVAASLPWPGAAPWDVAGAVLGATPPEPLRPPPFPVVGGLPPDLFVEGDVVEVDGDRGSATIEGVAESHVVTAFVERPDGRILLLRRSEAVGSFRGRWAGVSGFLEDPTPEGQAIRELREETGLDLGSTGPVATGPLVYARDGPRIWTVHPFRFRIDRGEVRLDWEHTEFEWVDPGEIARRPTVPHLDRAWAAVAPVPGERRKR